MEKAISSITNEQNVTIDEIKSIEDMILQLNINKESGTELKSRLEEIIQTLLSNNFVTNQQTEKKKSLLDKIENSKSKEELNQNLCEFIESFFISLTRKNGTIHFIIKYFKELKEKEIIIPSQYKEEKSIDKLLKIAPPFLFDFIFLFEYDSTMVKKREKIIEYINNLIKNKQKMSVVLKYMNLLFKILEDTKNENLIEPSKKLINVEGIIQNFKNDPDYEKYWYQLRDILLLFHDYVEEICQFFVLRRNSKTITKIILSNKLDSYISKDTHNKLKRLEENRSFSFHQRQLSEGNTRLIHLYDLFKDDDYFLQRISKMMKHHYPGKGIDKIILSKQYTEEIEEKFFGSSFNDNYLQLPSEIKTMFISDNNKSLLDFLDYFKEYDLIGIDSEWKPELSLFDRREHHSDIIQIACKKYVAVLDTRSFVKNEDMMNKFISIFTGKNFIGFSFSNDIKEMEECFKKFFADNTKCQIIELTDLYQIKNQEKKCPDLDTVCCLYLGKNLNKIDRMSNWKNRPLSKLQMHYCCLDAYILIELYEKMKEK